MTSRWCLPGCARPAAPQVEHVPTNLLWPHDLFALSHVAVPVPADDPVYGETRPASRNGRIWLGHAALYGERDMLLVPETALLRRALQPVLPVDDPAHQCVPGGAGAPRP